MATERIMAEYRNMVKSSDFKNIAGVEFVRDNLYTWKIVFDIT